jgi:hypothetical protein
VTSMVGSAGRTGFAAAGKRKPGHAEAEARRVPFAAEQRLARRATARAATARAVGNGSRERYPACPRR